MVRFLAAVITLCQALLGSSAQAQSSVWQNEVASLRGVDLGIKLADVPECPKRPNAILKTPEYWPNYDSNYPADFKDRVCWMSTTDRPLVKSAQAVTLTNLTFIKGAGREALATIIDGNIEALDVRFLSEHAPMFREAMIEKYGKPTKQIIRQYQNRLGARFDGVSLAWHGQRVTLTFDDVDGSTDWGLISMRTRVFDTALSSQAGGAKASVKSGL